MSRCFKWPPAKKGISIHLSTNETIKKQLLKDDGLLLKDCKTGCGEESLLRVLLLHLAN